MLAPLVAAAPNGFGYGLVAAIGAATQCRQVFHGLGSQRVSIPNVVDFQPFCCSASAAAKTVTDQGPGAQPRPNRRGYVFLIRHVMRRSRQQRRPPASDEDDYRASPNALREPRVPYLSRLQVCNTPKIAIWAHDKPHSEFGGIVNVALCGSRKIDSAAAGEGCDQRGCAIRARSLCHRIALRGYGSGSKRKLHLPLGPLFLYPPKMPWSISVGTEKKRGRPPGRTQSAELKMRVAPDFLQTVDEWRLAQPDQPSRSEAIRRLVERGMSEEVAKRWLSDGADEAD
jgi:hypothetical protein